MIKRSVRWIPVIYIALLCIAWFAGAAAGIFYRAPTVKHEHKDRARISAHASLAEVVANFKGAPYVDASLTELPGYVCHGWTNGKSSHGWVVIRCTK